MTRKENLLVEYCTLQNQINALRGKEQIDIEAYVSTPKFQHDSKYWKVYELEERIKNLTHDLDHTRREVEIVAKADDFYATAEGQMFRTKTEENIKQGEQEWLAFEKQTVASIEARLQTALGEEWGVSTYSTTNLRFGVKSHDSKRGLVFGQEVEVYYDERKRWNSDEERFEMNFGSCGSFDILDTTAESFAAFHIGVGRLLADEELCEWLLATLRDAKVEIDRMSDYLNQQHKNLKNPLGI